MFSRRDFIKQGLLPVFAGSAVPSIFANGVAAAAADAPRRRTTGSSCWSSWRAATTASTH